ncbi:MAG: hypothetical protein MK015_01620 [Alphaproteobacteria bacterium]|nr:hypothetical protein [Alphaproteobacteria bacterium]
MKLTEFKIFFALKLISSRFPMGVDTIYNPFARVSIILTLIFIVSCVPANNQSSQNVLVESYPEKISEVSVIDTENKDFLKKKQTDPFANYLLNTEVEIILPRYKKPNVTRNLINALELSIYKKEIKKISLNINSYIDIKELEKLLIEKAKPGKIFIGTLTPESSKIVKNYCYKGILFFSFAPDKSLADECVYLINFFPEDDLIALFNHFPEGSRIALLFPENAYGYYINYIIDPIADESSSLIVNRASYKEDLTNAREAIKELSKYELRKYELNRQKKILEKKDDVISKKALKKIEKFETIGEVDFTHLILPDYSIRLLEIAPLLPFYDVDPNKVKFVGTGVWDDKIFFDEPSLQGAIFSGIDEVNRLTFLNDYEKIYQEKPIRTATLPYDLLGIVSYIINQKMTIAQAYDLLDNSQIKFDGIDGKFSFVENVIFRELDILKIAKGSAIKLN